VPLITIAFCGLSGVGKTTCSKYLATRLFELGLPVYHIRFRHFSIKSFFQEKRQITHFSPKENISSSRIENKEILFEKFRLRSLYNFWFYAAYYLWRAYLLLLLVKVRYRTGIIIIDRYIYDNLTNYMLEKEKNRFIYKKFMNLLPQPDLSIVLYSGSDCIAKHRPWHSLTYTRILTDNYSYLKQLFPNLVFIESDKMETKMNVSFKIAFSFLKQRKFLKFNTRN
jgi:thymidylate kinase